MNREWSSVGATNTNSWSSHERSYESDLRKEITALSKALYERKTVPFVGGTNGTVLADGCAVCLAAEGNLVVKLQQPWC